MKNTNIGKLCFRELDHSKLSDLQYFDNIAMSLS